MATSVFVFLFLIFFINGLQVSSSSSLNPEKVNVSVYYETLNHNSAHFIVSNLSKIFYNEVISITKIRLVPWGNDRVNKSTNAIVCENGPDECLLNAVTTCAIGKWSNVNTHYGLIDCIEFLVIEGNHKDWKTCFDKLGLPLKPVLDCIDNGNVTKLALEYANETAKLFPRQTLLPWVVVNNHSLKEDYKDYTAYVCKSYKGNRVHGCSSSKPPTLPVAEEKMLNNHRSAMTLSSLMELILLQHRTIDNKQRTIFCQRVY
ncbi:hypothetical protein ACFE04_003086 [Oxalis oulophora]